MSHAQRKLFAEKMADLANIAAGALVFGQFVSGEQISATSLVMGIILALILYSASYLFSNISDNK